MSVNKVILVGNVGKTPDVRQAGERKVAQFTLATSEKYKTRDGNWAEVTEWHSIVAWDKLAEIAEKYVDKGTQLYIEGKIRTEKYTDKTGVEKFMTRIIANTMQLLGKPESKPSQESAPKPVSQPQPTAHVMNDPTDDLPF